MARIQEAKTTLQLHFDFISRKALLSVNGRGYVLPETYTTKEMAQAAAQKFAWEKLGFRQVADQSERPSDLAIWLH